jgi:hypothetical protein
MFSVTRFGKELDKSKYTWDEKNKVFSTKENCLVLDFWDYDRVTFNTGFGCIFGARNYCIFNTGSDCIFNTISFCHFNTSSHCTFATGNYCIFNTDSFCIFKTSSDCIFNTGSDCTFNTNSDCTFKTGENCVVIRRDVIGTIEIPVNKTIKLNDYKIAGYTEIEEIKKEIKESNCNGKVVIIDGKEYILQLK